MKFFIYYLIFFAGSSFAAAPSTEIFTAKRLDDTEITYYLTKPYGKNKFPIMLVLQGSKCKSVFDTVAKDDLIVKNGFARLDVEKYGLTKDSKNCPQEYLDNNSIDSRVSDILRVMQSIRKNPRWNHELIIIGGSEGAHLAPILATYIPETKKLVMMASGGGLTMAEDFILVTKAQLAKAAKNTNEIKIEIEKIEKQFNEMLGNPVSNKFYAGETNTYKWWASILKQRTANYLLELEIPIFLVHGDNDLSSSVETSRITEKMFNLKEKKNLRYKEYKDLDHHWFNKQGENKIKDVMLDILAWARQPQH